MGVAPAGIAIYILMAGYIIPKVCPHQHQLVSLIFLHNRIRSRIGGFGYTGLIRFGIYSSPLPPQINEEQWPIRIIFHLDTPMRHLQIMNSEDRNIIVPLEIWFLPPPMPTSICLIPRDLQATKHVLLPMGQPTFHTPTIFLYVSLSLSLYFILLIYNQEPGYIIIIDVAAIWGFWLLFSILTYLGIRYLRYTGKRPPPPPQDIFSTEGGEFTSSLQRSYFAKSC